MLSKLKYITVLLILLSIVAESCKTRKDCGGRRKRKIKTQMGGYM
ncbi:MAG: hypothetical protein ACK5QC_12675 [Bacteroidota bacterium]